MAYTLSINLADDDGETRLSVTRDYHLDDLGAVGSVMDHAVKSVALASEGVEKFGLTNTEEAA